MPILRGCCFCCDLKVGSRIIGILQLIGAIVNTLVLSVLVVVMYFMGMFHLSAYNFSKSDPEPQPEPSVDDEYSDLDQVTTIFEYILNHISLVTVIVTLMLGISIIMIITSSMLINGIKNNRRGLLMPFMVQEVIDLLIFLVLMIVIFVKMGDALIAVSIAMSLIAAVLIRGYFLLVVVSQYQALGIIRMHEEIGMK